MFAPVIDAVFQLAIPVTFRCDIEQRAQTNQPWSHKELFRTGIAAQGCMRRHTFPELNRSLLRVGALTKDLGQVLFNLHPAVSSTLFIKSKRQC